MKQDIFTGTAALSKLSEISRQAFSSVFVLCDENTLAHCYPRLKEFLPAHQTLIIKAGEEHKTLATCEGIWQQLTLHLGGRNSLLINAGGGVICDMGGFAAGCYKRGIPFINVPTTLLAMVDAAVGGKTGIDFAGYKNQIGLFCNASAVFVDTGFLKTLPDREIVSGFAEVIKHYLIAGKNEFQKLLNLKLPVRTYIDDAVIAKNIAIKQDITETDPLEKGPRKALNFGHTTGHAVESYFLQNPDKKLLHGEAVAIGMISESYISYATGGISTNELNEICEVIFHYFKLPVIPGNAVNDILKLMLQDKKNISGKTNFTLLNGIGNYNIDKSVEENVIIESVKYYNSMLA
jgi:3-dehydroquinate synthase